MKNWNITNANRLGGDNAGLSRVERLPRININLGAVYKRCFVCNKVIPWKSTKKLYCSDKCNYELIRKAKYTKTGKYTYRGERKTY